MRLFSRCQPWDHTLSSAPGCLSRIRSGTHALCECLQNLDIVFPLPLKEGHRNCAFCLKGHLDAVSSLGLWRARLSFGALLVLSFPPSLSHSCPRQTFCSLPIRGGCMFLRPVDLTLGAPRAPRGGRSLLSKGGKATSWASCVQKALDVAGSIYGGGCGCGPGQGITFKRVQCPGSCERNGPGDMPVLHPPSGELPKKPLFRISQINQAHPGLSSWAPPP